MAPKHRQPDQAALDRVEVERIAAADPDDRFTVLRTRIAEILQVSPESLHPERERRADG